MTKRNFVQTVIVALVLISLSLGAGLLSAQDKDKDTKNAAVPKNLDEYYERSVKSAEVLDEVMGIKEKGIPSDLLEKAKAIAVIPHVVKGAFGIGGRYGKGLVSQRLPDGRWSAPAFIEIGGGSFGLQIGASATDLVL